LSVFSWWKVNQLWSGEDDNDDDLMITIINLSVLGMQVG
jgi:hypothetical protein